MSQPHTDSGQRHDFLTSARQFRSGAWILFAGGAGTGKARAAEVLASNVGLRLHRVDLARVASKYIGETEKNLDSLFNKAERNNALLFFDEADALFGKWTDVKDANDRYANTLTNYLLQRMESFAGLAILATNFKETIEASFRRRLKHVVDFPLA